MSSKVIKDEDRPTENWPNKEFLTTVLRNWLGETKVNVTDSKSRIATNNGDSYSSHIFRVIVKCDQRKTPLTVIFKRLLDVNYSGEVLVTSFVREERMLRDVLPQMYAVLKKILPDMEPMGPSFIHSSPEGVLVMEDLQQGGFRMAGRGQGLDFKHCCLVLRTLARYHAASVYLMEHKSIDLSAFCKSLFGESNIIFGNFCNGMLRALSEEVERLNISENYAKKLSVLSGDNFHKILEQTLDFHEEDEFLVLSHGDLWLNNILFRYSCSGEPDVLRFVDFQLPCITSPCIDIQYFLTTSCNEHVRTSCIDQLLEEYYKTLCQIMTDLNCSTRPPTLERLRQDYDMKTHFGLYALACVMPLMYSKPTQFELSQIAVGGKPSAKLFRSETYKRALEWFLPIYECKGYL